jgi:hypothetical protein
MILQSVNLHQSVVLSWNWNLALVDTILEFFISFVWTLTIALTVTGLMSTALMWDFTVRVQTLKLLLLFILWIITTCGTLYVLAIPQTFADARWLNLSSNLHETAVTVMVPWHSTHDNLVVCNTVLSSNLCHKQWHYTWLTLCNWPSVSKFLLCLYI